MRFCTSLIALLLVLTTGAAVVDGQTQYWDIDTNSVAGAGSVNPSGIWNSSIFDWNVISTGLGLPTPWTPGYVAAFAAGTNATGTYSITVSGTQSLSGLTVEEGAITQNGGTLDFGSTIGAPISIASGTAWGETSSGVLAGTGGIVKSGSGTLLLRGTNTFTRAGSGNRAFLTINGGGVDFTSDANLGAAPSAENGTALSINGGTLRYSGSASIALATNRGVFIGASGATFDVANQIVLALAAGAPAASALTGSGTITKTGAGRLRLQTAQTTFTGKYVVKAGCLTFASQDRLGAVPAAVQADYFTLDGGGLYGDSTSGATLDAKRGITLGTSGGYLAFVGTGLTPYDGIISGTQGGTLTIGDTTNPSGSGTVSLNSANTYNGPTMIGNGMTLSVGILANGGINSGTGSSSNAAANLSLDGGTLLYRGAATSTDRNFTIAGSGGYIDASGANNAPLVFTSTAPLGLSGTGSHILVLRGTSTGDNTLSQAITDAGVAPTTVNKLDAGTWVLKNTANSYTGSTIISTGGRLKLGASGVIPDASQVQLFTGATLDLNGFDETVRSISGTSGTIALGSKTLTLNYPNGETYSGAITGSSGRILINGKLTLGSAATYDAGITSNGGSLGIGTNTALGTGYLGVNNAVTVGSVVTTPLTFTNSVVLNGNISFDDYTFISNPGSFTWDPSGTHHWTLYGGNRTITVSSVPGTYGVTINQPIGEDNVSRTLIKGGNGKLTLNGANTYTGNTTIEYGILSLGQPSLADASAVIMATGATLNLTFGSNTVDTIGAFFIDSVPQASGTWGGIGSAADHQTSLITGTGMLNVGPPVSAQPLAGDFNNDGKVDMGDYITWRKASGTNNALLNDNGLGVPIGQAHLDLWRQRFGNSPGAGSGGGLAGGTIPEPTAMLLFGIGLAGMVSAASRRRRRS